MEKEDCSTTRLVRSIMNIKKMFKYRGRKKKNYYDPEKVEKVFRPYTFFYFSALPYIGFGGGAFPASDNV